MIVDTMSFITDTGWFMVIIFWLYPPVKEDGVREGARQHGPFTKKKDPPIFLTNSAVEFLRFSGMPLTSHTCVSG